MADYARIYTSVTGTSSTETISASTVTFSYLKKSHVEVRVSNAGETLSAFKTRLAAGAVSASTYSTDYSIADNGDITFTTSTLADGSSYQVEVKRNSNIDARYVDFVDGSVVTEANLDDAQKQQLYLTQELADKKVDLLEDGTIAASISGSADTVVNLGTHNVTELADVTDAGSGAIITSSERTKLTNIEENATADQTGAEIKTAYEGESDTNAFTDAEKTKLGTVSSGAEVNVQSDWNASSGDAQILNKPTVPSSIDDLSDVSSSGASSGQVLKWSGSAWTPQNDLTGSGTGASTFIGLSDTPSSFTAGKWLKVNSSGNAIEETNAPITTDTNTTYDLSSQTDGSNVKIRLTDSDATTDDVTLAGAGSVAIAETSDTITFTGTDTTYSTVSTSDAGLAPALPASDGGKFLNASAGWTVPPDTDTTYTAGGGLTLSSEDEFSLNVGNQNAWTATQRSAFYTSYADDTTTFYTDTAQNWTWTVTASAALTGVTFEQSSGTAALTNANGQSGFILLTNAGGTIAFSTSTTLTHADVVNTISGVSGTFLISYICNGTKVCLTNSKALT